MHREDMARLYIATAERFEHDAIFLHPNPGGGYIFSTSNCIYTGMRLCRYEMMLDVWRKFGNYPG